MDGDAIVPEMNTHDSAAAAVFDDNGFETGAGGGAVDKLNNATKEVHGDRASVDDDEENRVDADVDDDDPEDLLRMAAEVGQMLVEQNRILQGDLDATEREKAQAESHLSEEREMRKALEHALAGEKKRVAALERITADTERSRNDMEERLRETEEGSQLARHGTGGVDTGEVDALRVSVRQLTEQVGFHRSRAATLENDNRALRKVFAERTAGDAGAAAEGTPPTGFSLAAASGPASTSGAAAASPHSHSGEGSPAPRWTGFGTPGADRGVVARRNVRAATVSGTGSPGQDMDGDVFGPADGPASPEVAAARTENARLRETVAAMGRERAELADLASAYEEQIDSLQRKCRILEGEREAAVANARDLRLTVDELNADLTVARERGRRAGGADGGGVDGGDAEVSDLVAAHAAAGGVPGGAGDLHGDLFATLRREQERSRELEARVEALRESLTKERTRSREETRRAQKEQESRRKKSERARDEFLSLKRAIRDNVPLPAWMIRERNALRAGSGGGDASTRPFLTPQLGVRSRSVLAGSVPSPQIVSPDAARAAAARAAAAAAASAPRGVDHSAGGMSKATTLMGIFDDAAAARGPAADGASPSSRASTPIDDCDVLTPMNMPGSRREDAGVAQQSGFFVVDSPQPNPASSSVARPDAAERDRGGAGTTSVRSSARPRAESGLSGALRGSPAADEPAAPIPVAGNGAALGDPGLAAGDGHAGGADVQMSLPPPAMMGELAKYPGFLSPDLRALATSDARHHRALTELRRRVQKHETESARILDGLAAYDSVSRRVADAIASAHKAIGASSVRTLNRDLAASGAAAPAAEGGVCEERARITFLVEESNRRLRDVASSIMTDFGALSGSGESGGAGDTENTGTDCDAAADADGGVARRARQIAAAVRALLSENVELRQQVNSISEWAFERTLAKQEKLRETMLLRESSSDQAASRGGDPKKGKKSKRK